MPSTHEKVDQIGQVPDSNCNSSAGIIADELCNSSVYDLIVSFISNPMSCLESNVSSYI